MLINLRNAMMAGKRLPYDAEVEYLESTGTQWIDTGVNVTTSTGFEITAKFNSTAMGVFGCNPKTDYSAQWTRFQFGRRDNVVGSSYLFWGIWSGQNYNHNIAIDYSKEHTFKYIPSLSDEFFVDSTSYRTGYNNNKIYPLTSPTFVMFANNDVSDTVNLMCSALCYGAKFYDGSTLVRDFIPVRVGDVGYLYDRVSGQLFGNAGTGAFGYGNDI